LNHKKDMSTPPPPIPRKLDENQDGKDDKDVTRLIDLGREAGQRAVRFDGRKKFDLAKRAYDTGTLCVFST
jgi:hypothetical protein